MAHVYDHQTGLGLGDPDRDPLGAAVPVPTAMLAAAREPLIVSASGWRKVFAADGDEDSDTEDVAPADRELVMLAGAAFSEYMLEELPTDRRTVVLGLDARPTGTIIAEILLRVVLSHGLGVEYLFITPIPEIIAYSRSIPHAGAFLYASASHNPLGHNGLKFGFAGEGVLPGSKAAEVAARFERLLNEPERRAEIAHLARGVSAETVRGVYEEVARLKPRAVSAYRVFALEVADGPAGDGAARAAIATGVAQDGCGVVVDFNGSARATSIDTSLLQELGIRTATLNDAPRAVAHQILPEGPGLDPARAALTERAAADASYTLAYVPDNDGDRGNVVFAGAETALDAQEVFALAVVAELAWLSASGLRPTAEQPWAVVVNGPTSLRIERIAAAFDAEVHRCEVGEANVVETAARLRDAGYLVRILGEGSNGGNILHPSAVRDPIATVGAFLKLLYAYRGTERDLFGEWCGRSNNETRYRSSFTLEDVRATLPAFRTTATGRPKAKLAVRTRNYSELKRRYREVFDEEWRSRQAELARTYHVVDYEEIRYEGTTSRVMPKGRGAVPASGRGSVGGAVPASGRGSVGGAVPAGGGPGGLKIQLYDHDGRAVAFLWMRGSGTEPVFRAVVDIEGTDQAAEEQLLDWHRSMIERADRLAAGR